MPITLDLCVFRLESNRLLVSPTTLLLIKKQLFLSQDCQRKGHFSLTCPRPMFVMKQSGATIDILASTMHYSILYFPPLSYFFQVKEIVTARDKKGYTVLEMVLKMADCSRSQDSFELAFAKFRQSLTPEEVRAAHAVCHIIESVFSEPFCSCYR